jgi:hypothetical protein
VVKPTPAWRTQAALGRVHLATSTRCAQLAVPRDVDMTISMAETSTTRTPCRRSGGCTRT